MLTRNIDKAKEAYKIKDIEATKAAHRGHVHSEPHKQNHGQYIGSAVYGGLDGIITTFAVVTFGSFGLFGFVPLLAFTVAQLFSALTNHTFLIASVMTGLTLFLLGALKVRLTNQKWYKSGMEMLLVGGVAASAAYLVGVALKGFA